MLPPGRYTYTAASTLDGVRLTAKGEFLVKPMVAEQLSTVADHALLAAMAARTQGLFVLPSELGRIADDIEKRGTIAARSYAHASFSDLIGLRWLFFVLLTLLTLEWALRRRNGSY